MAATSSERIRLEHIKKNRDANIIDARNALQGEYEYIIESIDRSRTVFGANPFGVGLNSMAIKSVNLVKLEIVQSTIEDLLNPSKNAIVSSQNFFKEWSAEA